MSITQLNEEIIKILNELDKKHAGYEIPNNFADFDQIINKMIELYDNKQLGVYIPKTLIFKENDKEYELALVMGGSNLNAGISHLLNSHSNPKHSKVKTQEELRKAVKNTNKAIEFGTRWYDRNDKNKFIIEYKGFAYVICLASNENELTFLLTAFKPDNAKYFKKNFYRK